MYCVNDKNKSMTDAQILVNLTSYSTKQWNETSLQLLLCIALERGRPHRPTI